MVLNANSDQNSSSSDAGHGEDIPSYGLGQSETSLEDNEDQNLVHQIDQLYARERDKRIRLDAATQFVDAEVSDKFKRFAADCWADSEPSTSKLILEEGEHYKVLIVGAGFGGLLFAVRLLEAGFDISDLVMIDAAGGFGGTWYWNRYPGLMCDVESYIYLPLLEETGYMPKHKYSYGDEIREHANRIARKWALDERAIFRTQAQKLLWDDDRHLWHVEMIRLDGSNFGKTLNITADFVIAVPGFLHSPQVNAFNGVNHFRGHSFHTARWDYEFTGGSPEDPSLVNLKDLKVGIVGTGATAIQAIPHLAQWSKQLYVFQRTPASVDVRGQHATDLKWWSRETQGRKGWQKHRMRNFISFTTNEQPRPEIDMINDGWTSCPSFSGVVGTPRKIVSEDIPRYVDEMQTMDLQRSERIRARAEEVVKDSDTANNLKHWYYAWCKRPTFHDEYLATFNRPNVTLVDTNGRGIDDVSESGIIANDQLYNLDVIVYSTGFAWRGGASPAGRAGITTFGRNGRHLEEKWTQDLSTLHGVMTRDFPNLFFNALSQGAGSVNFTSALDCAAQHVAFIMAEASRRAGPDCRVAIEPTATAEKNWVDVILAGSTYRAPAAGCTPSYYNGQGMVDKLSPAMKKKAARATRYPYGLNSFSDYLDEWHKKGDLSDLDINVCPPADPDS